MATEATTITPTLASLEHEILTTPPFTSANPMLVLHYQGSPKAMWLIVLIAVSAKKTILRIRSARL